MTGCHILDVVDGGLQTTVQDLGRPGYRDQGVPTSGACDRAALALANRLVGNPPDAAALECTLLGPTLESRAEVRLALAGADLGAVLDPGGRVIRPGVPFVLVPGERLHLTGPAGPGCRAYLAVEGGLDVPVVLGSRSTSLPGHFGGHEGRPLRAGDVLARVVPADVAPHPAPMHRGSAPGGSLDTLIMSDPLRVIPAPVPDHPRGRALQALIDGDWIVSPASDRRGLRLAGPRIPIEQGAGDGSQPMIPGAVQVTPDGTPILLLADSGTTGGYPAIAVVISADLRLAGQARPGDLLHFVAVGLDVAREAAQADDQRLGAATANG